MKIFLISIISILVITLFVVGGFFFFAKKKEDIYTDKNFIANVNGEFIHLEDFRKKLNLVVKITKIPYNNKQFDKSKFKNIILQNLIEEKLVLEEVKRLGIDIDSNLLETQVLLAFNSFAGYNSDYTLFQNSITKETWQDAYEKSLIKQSFYNYLKKSIKINSQEIASYYKNNLNEFISLKQHEILHLQVDSIEVAQFLERRIKKKTDFENLILEYSIAENKSYEGDSSFFVQEGSLPKLFNEAIFKLTLSNPTSPIIRSEFGFHIFQLKSVLPRKKLSLEGEASPLIIKAIQKQKIAKVYQKWLLEKKKLSKIVINREVLENGIDI